MSLRTRFAHLIITAEAATPDLVALNAAIYRAAGFPPGEGAGLDLLDFGFPPEMLRLGLGPLLRLILFVGSTNEKHRLRRKQLPFTATDLAVSSAERIRIPARCLREVCNRRLAGPDSRPAPILFGYRAAEFPLGDRERGGGDRTHGRRANLGPCPSRSNWRDVPECAPGREPHRVLDSTGIVEPMDCRSRRGTRALYAATRGGGGTRPK